MYECFFNTWTPKIGDPNVMGWVTVGAYFIAALLTLLVFFRVKYISWDEEETRNRIFWLLLVLLLVFLGINKQMDLQTYFTDVGRCMAKMGDWYNGRREVQLIFIVSIGMLFTLVGVLLVWYFRRNMAQNWLAIIGVSVLMAFILIRAASFHHFDIIINYRFYGIRMNWVLELSGILLICIQAMINLRKKKMVIVKIPNN